MLNNTSQIFNMNEKIINFGKTNQNQTYLINLTIYHGTTFCRILEN